MKAQSVPVICPVCGDRVQVPVLIEDVAVRWNDNLKVVFYSSEAEHKHRPQADGGVSL